MTFFKITTTEGTYKEYAHRVKKVDNALLVQKKDGKHTSSTKRTYNWETVCTYNYNHVVRIEEP